MDNEEKRRCGERKMSALARLAADIAHDLNNSVGAIEGYAAFVIKALPAGDPIRSDMEDLLKAEQQAAALGKQLSMFSRRGPAVKTAVKLDGFIAGFRKKVSKLSPGVVLEVSAAPGLGSVPADAGQLEQALLELVLNARDAMPGGGTVKLGIGNADLGGAAPGCPRPEAPGTRFVRISVADAGAGMNADVLDHLFEPYFTTKPKGKGKGLGLAMAYGIVYRHNGWLEVRSEQGKGSVFTIYLPQSGEAKGL